MPGPFKTHTWPPAHALQPGVPGAHTPMFSPQVHAPSTQVCAAEHVVPQPPQFIVSPAVSTHCEPQQAPPTPHRSPGARGSSHGMHTPETQNSSMPGQS